MRILVEIALLTSGAPLAIEFKRGTADLRNLYI
jgi:hypothetical protein